MAEYTFQRFHAGRRYEFARVSVEAETSETGSAVLWAAEPGADLLHHMPILVSGVTQALVHHQRVTGRRVHVHITGFVGNDADVSERAMAIAAQMATHLALGNAEEDFEISLDVAGGAGLGSHLEAVTATGPRVPSSDRRRIRPRRGLRHDRCPRRDSGVDQHGMAGAAGMRVKRLARRC